MLTQVKDIRKYYSSKGKKTDQQEPVINASASLDATPSMTMEDKTELKDLFNHQLLQLRKELEMRVTEISQR